MKNKALLIAGLGSALAIASASALSFVSANDVTPVTSTAITQSAGKAHAFGKGMMKKGEKMMERGMGMMEKGKFGKGNAAMQTAVTNNDYNAFVTARNADTNKPTNATVPTQDQFTQMVKQEQKHTAVETAIKNNDYNAYVTAKTPMQEEFAQRVTQYNTRQATDAAIAANDYDAFVTAWNSDTHKPANATVPTKEQFAKMVTRQTANK